MMVVSQLVEVNCLSLKDDGCLPTIEVNWLSLKDDGCLPTSRGELSIIER